MRFWTITRLRLRSLFKRHRVEDELDEELRYHLERQIDENIAVGMSPQEARQAALHSISGLEQRKEECRDARGWNVVDNLRGDVRFALRQLRKNPGFTATAILMLALGMCASVAIFGFVDAALLKPLPYRDPNRLIMAFEFNKNCSQCGPSYLDYLDWKKLNQVFRSIDAYRYHAFTLRTPDSAQSVTGFEVTDGFFRTLGVAPVIGRDFHDGEASLAAPRTVLLSYAAWQQRYGGKPDVLGKTVMLGGDPNVIIGVLPQHFHFAASTAEFWPALHPEGSCIERRNCHGMHAVGRLKDGVSILTAQANFQTIALQLAHEYPASNRGWGAKLVPLSDVMVENLRPILIMLLSGTALLLLIAGVNVASLLLVRSESRTREMAVRTALGASKARILSQFVTEGFILSILGGALGIASASWIMQLLVKLIPPDMLQWWPFFNDLGWD
ncbi:MAG TPA: ABC transporter permease, partial [Bryobacteraceae bacterium]